MIAPLCNAYTRYNICTISPAHPHNKKDVNANIATREDLNTNTMRITETFARGFCVMFFLFIIHRSSIYPSKCLLKDNSASLCVCAVRYDDMHFSAFTAHRTCIQHTPYT